MIYLQLLIDSKFTRDYVKDECRKTFCLLDRLETHPDIFQMKGSKIWAQQILNGIYEKGAQNEYFDFVSTVNLSQVVAPYQSFFENRYFQGIEFREGNPRVFEIIDTCKYGGI